MNSCWKLLHLEESYADSQMLKETLLKAGIACIIRRVDTRDSFLEALSSFSPDIILADHAVPNFTAEDALRDLKMNTREIPLVVITCPVSEKFAAKMFRQGAADYLLKEDLQELPEVIRRITKYRLATMDNGKGPATEEIDRDYEFFFRHSLDALLLTSPEGEIFGANPAACRIFQRTEEELCAVGRSGIVDPKDPSLQKAIEKRQEEGKVRAEIKMIKRDGSRFDAELTSANYTDAFDRLRSVVIIRDISERKTIERELKMSRENYESLFRNSPLPNWIYDSATLEIIDVNQAALLHYGYTREEFLQMTLLELRPEDEISSLESDLKSIKEEEEDGVVRYGEFKHRKKDGTIIKVEVSGYRLMLDHRKCRFVVCIDITERELFLKKLEKKSAKLQAAQEIAKLGTWEYCMDKRSLSWSGEVFKIWGISSEEFRPSYSFFLKSIFPDDRSAFVKQLNETIEGTRRELHLEHRIVLTDGTVKWVEERGRLFTNKKGKSLFEGTVQDITEKKSIIEDLQRSESRHKGILKSQTNYLIRTDLEGNVTYCNEKYLKDFGWIYEGRNPEGQIATLSIKEYHKDRIKECFERSLEKPYEVCQVELDKETRNGDVKTTLWDLVCLTDSRGEAMEIQAVGIDITDRVKTEKLLKESTTRYELVSKATSDVIYDWDLNSHHLTWGESFSSMFGHEKIGPNLNEWSLYLHPDDSDRVLNSLKSFLNSTGQKWSEEYRYRKANGEYAQVIESGYLIRDEEQRAQRMVGAINDVTGKRKLEDLLNKASRLARIGSFEYDVETQELFWSSTIKEIFELPEDYVPQISSSIEFYEAEEDKKAVLEAFNRSIQEHKSYEYEGLIITGKGNKRWIKVVADPELEDGRCVRVNGSCQDIDKMKRAEMKTMEASREKEIILESIGDAFFAVNGDWIVTYWNKQAEDLLGCPKEEILGKTLWETFNDAVGTDFFRNYETALETRETRHFEAFYERLNKWFEVNVYPSASGLSVYFKDVSERRKAEAELHELNLNLQNYTQELVAANKGLEQFSYIVSHNLRSPVANILGLAALLEEEDYPAALKETLLKELLGNVERLDTIIRDLNDILQVKGHLDASREEVILEDLVERVTSGIVSQMGEDQVVVETDFEVPNVHTVLSYLHSVFYNLITNSIKYRRAEVNPRILISSKRENGELIISYRDNGMGIDLEAKKEQIFGLYKRFHQHVEGKGMGLFMVKTQIELLGGRISVSSEVGKGTEFLISFKGEPNIAANQNAETGTIYSSR